MGAEGQAPFDETGIRNKNAGLTLVKKFRVLLDKTLHHRWLVIGTTVGIFILALLGMALVRKEFFPPSTRPELIVEMTLPTGASIHATDAEMKRIMNMLQREQGVINFSGYVAQSAPRFVLVQDSSMAADITHTCSADRRGDRTRSASQES